MLKVQILKLNKEGKKIFTHIYSIKLDFEDALQDIAEQIEVISTYTKVFLEYFEITLDLTIKTNLPKYLKYHVDTYNTIKRLIEHKRTVDFLK